VDPEQVGHDGELEDHLLGDARRLGQLSPLTGCLGGFEELFSGRDAGVAELFAEDRADAFDLIDLRVCHGGWVLRGWNGM